MMEDQFIDSGAGVNTKRDSSSDEDIDTFVRIIHDRAKPFQGMGRLVVASYGDDPETGKKIETKVDQFEIGDTRGMAAFIKRLSREQHRNPYVSLGIVRPDLGRRNKGAEEDLVAVIALCGDFDDDNARNWRNRIPVDPSFVLETSEDRFQVFFLFDAPVPPMQAKDLAVRLKTFCGCDHGTADVSHVWRVPGTLNRPNRKKVTVDGRSTIPQLVRIEEEWVGLVYSPEDLDKVLPPIPTPEPAPTPDRKTKAWTEPSSRDDCIPDFPDWIENILSTPYVEGTRSEPAYAAIQGMIERGWTDQEIISKVAEYPNGPTSRYKNEKHLSNEIRGIRTKTNPANVRDRYNGHSHNGTSKVNGRDRTTQKKSEPSDDGGADMADGSMADGSGSASKTDQSGWPDPAPLQPEIPPAPPFPTDCLPHIISEAIKDEAHRSQTPVEMYAIPQLTVLGGGIGVGAVIRPKAKDDWEETSCTWGVVIAKPGMRKSSAISYAVAPLKRLQKMKSKNFAEEHAKWLERKAEADMRMKMWADECKRRMNEGGYDCELPPKPKVAEELPDEPIPQRCLTTEPTVEEILRIMQGSRGMTLHRDELSGFVQNMGRYNNGSDRQFYLQCYSGDSYTSDRVGRGSTTVDHLYLNIVGGIQPKIARKVFAIDDGSDDGFFDRFSLMCYPDIPDEWEFVDEYPNINLKNSVYNIVETLANADWGKVLHSDAAVERGDKRPYCRFSEEAQQVFNDWYCEYAPASMRIGEVPTAGFIHKKSGLLARLTLIIHLTSWAAGEESCPRTVSVRSLSRAISLLEEFLVPTWERIFASFGKSKTVRNAARIAKLIINDKKEGIRVSDILKLEWAELNTRDDIEAAFDELVARDWLAPPVRNVGRKGGRPSETYLVNPKVAHMTVGYEE